MLALNLDAEDFWISQIRKTLDLKINLSLDVHVLQFR